MATTSPCTEPLACTLALLRQLVADRHAYDAPEHRELRVLVAQLGSSDVATRDARAATSQARNAAHAAARRNKQADATAVANTALRAGRMQRLAALSTQDAGAVMPQVLDGVVETVLAPCGGAAATDAPAPALLATPRACYICKTRYSLLHAHYDALCPPCASLNWEKRHAAADLCGRVALVTGARVKIGFCIALKLLRCGATVIATTRFAHDAAARFAAQPDAAAWRERLHVYSLDLRDLGALEAFCSMLTATLPRLDVLINNACQTVRRPPAYYAHLLAGEAAPLCALPQDVAPLVARYAEWRAAGGGAAVGNSDAASQHLGWGGADGADARALTRTTPSGQLAASSEGPPLPPTPAQLSQLELVAGDDARPAPLVSAAAVPSFPVGLYDTNAQQVDLRDVTSWVLRLSDVSLPEAAEVMAINVLAPLLLCARLKPLMLRAQGPYACGESDEAGGDAPPLSLAEVRLEEGVGSGARVLGAARGQRVGGAARRPLRETDAGRVHGDRGLCPTPAARFIVNVSSMEGRFYRPKTATHPHTNAAKAALNMLTRTSSGDYAEACVYMTAVDTGWINDDHPSGRAMAKAAVNNFSTPLDEIDAAARVLDPVLAPLAHAQAAGARVVRPIYGAFLKDYFPTEW